MVSDLELGILGAAPKLPQSVPLSWSTTVPIESWQRTALCGERGPLSSDSMVKQILMYTCSSQVCLLASSGYRQVAAKSDPFPDPPSRPRRLQLPRVERKTGEICRAPHHECRGVRIDRFRGPRCAALPPPRTASRDIGRRSISGLLQKGNPRWIKGRTRIDQVPGTTGCPRGGRE